MTSPAAAASDARPARAHRILFLRNSRGITDVTGAETYLLTVLAGLQRAGCDVLLQCADILEKGETPWLSVLKERGLPHEVIDVPNKFSLADFAAARRAVRDFAPSVIHATDHRSDAVAAWLSARTGVPAVASFFGWTNWAKSTLRGRLYPMADRFVMRRLRKIIVDSDYVGSQVRSAAPDSQIAVVRNGVDLRRFDPDRVTGNWKRHWFGRDDVFLVTMIGRLHPNKGQLDMAEAAARLLRDHPNMRFVVLGDPPPGHEDYAASVAARLEALGINDRFLLTNVESAAIPSVLASTDVTAIPSYMESLSYVMLETMAMSKPVVSSRVGGHGDLIRNGENGMLFEPGDIDALAAALDRLAREPDLARQIGKAGRETVRAGYSTQAMVAQTCAIYDEVTA